jgi:hypothetical protein
MLVRHHVTFLADDHARALALGRHAADTPLATPAVQQALGPLPGGIDADHGWHDRLRQLRVLGVQAGQQFHVTQLKRRSVGKGGMFRAVLVRGTAAPSIPESG